MKGHNESTPSSQELAGRFEAIALAQDKAFERSQYSQYSRLLKELQIVRDKLKALPGDGRLALLPLLGSENEHVRLQAAGALTSVAYAAARETLQRIADDKFSPYCLDASFSLRRLNGETLSEAP